MPSPPCGGAEGARPADAVVVLGCRGAEALRRRLDCGLCLHRAGGAPLLLLSGGGAGTVPEAESMRAMALAAGVPEAAILVEATSRDTVGNARECARLLRARGLFSVILVTDRAHLPRAALLFRLAGIEVRGRRAPPPARRGRAWAYEIAAWPGSLARALLTRRGR